MFILPITYVVFIKSTKMFLITYIYSIFLECRWHYLKMAKWNEYTLPLKKCAPLTPQAEERGQGWRCSFSFPPTHAHLVITLYLTSDFIFICLIRLFFIALGRRQYQTDLANVRFLLCRPGISLKLISLNIFKFLIKSMLYKPGNFNQRWLDV